MPCLCGLTLEQWSFVSQIVLAIAAVGGTIGAIWQLRLLLQDRRKETSKETKAERARLLLQLDTRWESRELEEARRQLHELTAEVDKSVGQLPPLGTATREQRATRASEILADYREREPERYWPVSRLWGFIETMGYLWRAGQLELEEIDELFGAAILQIDDLARKHLEARAEELAQSIGYSSPSADPVSKRRGSSAYKNMISLMEALRARGQSAT